MVLLMIRTMLNVGKSRVVIVQILLFLLCNSNKALLLDMIMQQRDPFVVKRLTYIQLVVNELQKHHFCSVDFSHL